MIPKRAHFSWLARKAQAAARARRLIPPLLLSVFIVLSSVSNTVAQVGWSTPMPSWDGPAPATSVADRCFTGNLNGDRSNPDGDRMTDFWCTTGTGSSTWLIETSTAMERQTCGARRLPATGQLGFQLAAAGRR